MEQTKPAGFDDKTRDRVPTPNPTPPGFPSLSTSGTGTGGLYASSRLAESAAGVAPPDASSAMNASAGASTSCSGTDDLVSQLASQYYSIPQNQNQQPNALSPTPLTSIPANSGLEAHCVTSSSASVSSPSVTSALSPPSQQQASTSRCAWEFSNRATDSASAPSSTSLQASLPIRFASTPEDEEEEKFSTEDAGPTFGSVGILHQPPTAVNPTMSPPVDLFREANRSMGTPPMHGNIPTGELAALKLQGEPENEPIDGMEKKTTLAEQLPATFLKTICDQLEYYFCDENLLGDLFLLKNMNMDGYVKLDLLASFGRVKKLTTDLEQIKKSLELSTKLILNEDETMVCRKEPLAAHQTYHGKLARTAIAYNLPEDASVASLREKFQGCGEITYLRLLKNNASIGRNAVLKPPIVAGETYAIIEFADEEMAKHAVLTLSDQYNWRTGMQVVLFDGTNVDKLKQKMFPVDMGDRRRAKSTSAVMRPVHVEAVGEGLDGLKEGKVSTGTVYSIRGAGGLITPTRLENACISFRLVPDEDGTIDIKQGDYVSFTVGKNKKSGRKYASKVKLEFRPPASLTENVAQKDYFSHSAVPQAPMSNPWEMGRGEMGRSRARTVGAPPPMMAFRGRATSTGSRPKLTLTSSPRGHLSPPGSSASGPYRQALGPDGSRGFGARRTGALMAPPINPEVIPDFKFATVSRTRSSSNPQMPNMY